MFHVFASVIQGFKLRVHLVSLLFNALHFLWAVFLLLCFVSMSVPTLWMARSKMFYNISIGFNEAKTNCRIAQVLALYCGTVVTFLSAKKNLPSVLFEEII